MEFSKKNRYSFLVGEAGTGKTRNISENIIGYLKKKENYLYLAPTHKAKNVLEEELKEHDSNAVVNTMTVARFIQNSHYGENYKHIIIDEITMVRDEE